MLEGADKATCEGWLLSFEEASFNQGKTEQWLISIIRTSPDFSGVWVFCEQRQGKLQPTRTRGDLQGTQAGRRHGH